MIRTGFEITWRHFETFRNTPRHCWSCVWKLFGIYFCFHILDVEIVLWSCFHILGENVCSCGPRGHGTIAQSRFVSVSIYLLFEIAWEPYFCLRPLLGNNMFLSRFTYFCCRVLVIRDPFHLSRKHGARGTISQSFLEGVAKGFPGIAGTAHGRFSIQAY